MSSGGSSTAPDYTPLANASNNAVKVLGDLGKQQLDFAKSQYLENKPIYNNLVQQQLDISKQTQNQAEDYNNYNKTTFRPLEQGIVDNANNYNSDANKEVLASKAAADAAGAFKNTQDATMANMAAMGVNPNSPRFSAINNQNALKLSAIRGNAMTGARLQAENTGYARKLDAAGLGRNLPGASQAAYGLSLNSGNSAGTNAGIPGSTYSAQSGNSANTTANGFQMQLGGLGNLLGNQTSLQGGTNSNNSGMMGSLIGGGMGMAGSMMSDPRLKENITFIGVKNGHNWYQFNYTDKPDKAYRGVMADEVIKKVPEAVTICRDGFMMVNYNLLGLAPEVV